MDRAQLIAELKLNHERFLARILALPAAQLDATRAGKWTPAQHVDHIQRATAPVAMALMVPKWFLRWRFGRPNRAVRDYDALVQRYKEKLADGGRASGRFVPPVITASEVPRVAASVQRVIGTLVDRLDKWSGSDLDSYLLPHPLLGKITVREMLYFTIYHVQHHQALVERDTA